MRWRPKRHDKAVVVSALGITQTLAWASTYYLTAVFTDPVSADLHLSRTWFYGSVSASLLLSGLLGPAAGRIIDRYGGRDVLTATNLVFAVGLVLLSFATGPISLAAAWLVIGVGMGFGLYEAAFATVAGLYGREARNAITGITLFAGFASTVGWPLSAAMIDAFGWRAALLCWAALQVLLGLPLNRWLVPQSPPPAPVAAPTGVVAGGVPWTMIILAGVFGATWFVSTALAAHLPRLLEAMGATPAAAIAAGALVGPAQVAARVAEFSLLRHAAPMISARLAAGVASTRCGAAGPARHAGRHRLRAAARRRQRHADDRARHPAASAIRRCWIRASNRPSRRTRPHSARRCAASVRPRAR